MKSTATWFYNYFFNADAILKSKRLSWIDYAKGIAIFLVVYHHAFLGLQAAGLKVNTWLINTNMIVYSFRVPLFFILSGVFIQQGLKKRGLKKYIGYRSRILLYPYLLWAFLQISLSYFFRAYTNFPWGAKLYLFIFYEPKYMGQLWYLLALFNASVIYVLLYTKLKIRGMGHLVLGIILYLLAPALSFNSMLQQFSIFYIYLAIGTLISSVILDHKNDRIFGSWKTFLIILPFFIVSQLYFIHHENMDPFFMNFDKTGFSGLWLISKDGIMLQYFLIVIIGCMLTVNICFFLQKWGRLLFLRVIGFHSLYIYLLHLILVVVVRTIFIYFIHYDNTAVILLLQIITACAGSVMIYNTCRHWNLNFLFEFDPADLKKFLHINLRLPQFQKV